MFWVKERTVQMTEIHRDLACDSTGAALGPLPFNNAESTQPIIRSMTSSNIQGTHRPRSGPVRREKSSFPLLVVAGRRRKECELIVLLLRTSDSWQFT